MEGNVCRVEIEEKDVQTKKANSPDNRFVSERTPRTPNAPSECLQRNKEIQRTYAPSLLLSARPVVVAELGCSVCHDK